MSLGAYAWLSSVAVYVPKLLMPWQRICHSSSLFFSHSFWLPGRLFLALKYSNFHEMSKARLIIFFLWPSCHLCHFSQLSSINVLPDWEEKGLFSVVGAECFPNSAITSNPASSLQCVWCTSVQALTHEVDVLDGPQIVLMYYNNLCFFSTLSGWFGFIFFLCFLHLHLLLPVYLFLSLPL